MRLPPGIQTRNVTVTPRGVAGELTRTDCVPAAPLKFTARDRVPANARAVELVTDAIGAPALTQELVPVSKP